MERLRQRRDFRAAARGRKVHDRAWVLQCRCRDDDGPARFGFTVTRKVAARAVERNRIRRRLKEAVRRLDAGLARPGADIVIVARRQALTEPFERLVGGLGRALASLKMKPAAAEGRPNGAADG